MVIRFLGIPLEEFDKLCKYKEVEITISCLQKDTFKHTDGTSTIDRVLTSKWSGRVMSSKDIFQFDYDDIKKLNRKERKSLV